MTEALYSEEKLFELGRSNYDRLVLYCETLESNGFWEQAEKVMKQSSTEVLDIYVQSVLMNLAVHCDMLLERQQEFISAVTATNPFDIPASGQVDRRVYSESKRFYELPPVLLQLCGLYDKQTEGDMTEYFLDALLNILLCMAHLDKGNDSRVNEFIQSYYDKISNFVISRDAKDNSEYIVKKLTSGKIQCEVEWFHRAKEEKQRRKEEFHKKVAEVTKVAEENEKRIAQEQFLAVKKRIQEREKAEREEKEKRIKALVDELNALVGLSAVKQEIQSLINLIKIRNLREQMDMPVMDMSYHMVFTGSPGTGKTTVARLVGKIYKELGILSDGKMIETDRSGLVAGYVGQTAMKVHEVVEQAIGGILFIDEAYSLVNPDMPNDFGMEAVDALVKLMEDHRDNLVIIVAGYTEEMKTFLKSNTGLISRFNKFISFPDYTNKELIAIMNVMAKNAGLVIEDGAKKKVLRILNKMAPEMTEEFGNARGIRNMFEKIVTNQANRLVQIEEPTRKQLMTIIADDVAKLV